MRERKKKKLLCSDLLKELTRIVSGNHICRDHTYEGMDCLICTLQRQELVFSLLNYLRYRGIIRRTPLLNSEIALITELGEERVRALADFENKFLTGLPKKFCPHCGRTVFLMKHFTDLKKTIAQRGKYNARCGNCENLVVISMKDLDPNYKEDPKKEKLSAIFKKYYGNDPNGDFALPDIDEPPELPPRMPQPTPTFIGTDVGTTGTARPATINNGNLVIRNR